MAGARDIRRRNLLRRREQAERNEKANQEREDRLAEMADKAGMTPGERRLLDSRRLRRGVNRAKIVRDGHRVTYLDGLEAVEFASGSARKKARQFELTPEDFDRIQPSGAGGKYNAKDVQALMLAIEIEAESANGSQDGDADGPDTSKDPDGTEDGEGDESPQNDADGPDGQDGDGEEKQDQEGHEDKMETGSGVQIKGG